MTNRDVLSKNRDTAQNKIKLMQTMTMKKAVLRKTS